MPLLAALFMLALSDAKFEVFTSTREVLAIARDPRHRWLKVVTSGGVLTRYGDGWHNDLSPREPGKAEPIDLEWNGDKVHIEPFSIQIGDKNIELPASTGSHISSATVHDGKLLVAVFDAGVFAYDRAWKPIESPEKDVTALASIGGELWLGTHRHGAFHRKDDRWVSLMPQNEIPNHNIQSLAWLDGTLYACTLEDSLITYAASRWKTVDGLSSNAPRQVLPFLGRLYIRHGTGAIDVLAAKITRGFETNLPRKQATTLATDGKSLFVGQWGGWSEYDGNRWRHHFDVPELRGVQVTWLAATKDDVWVGTQGSGLLRIGRSSEGVKAFDERSGLKDDWITCLAVDGTTVLAGTFAGSLARIEEGSVTTGGPLGIRALAPPYFASMSSLWRVEGNRFQPTKLPFEPREIQAICITSDSIWIGCRTALYRLEKLP